MYMFCFFVVFIDLCLVCSTYTHFAIRFLFIFFFFNDTATTEIYTVLTHSFPTRRSSDLTSEQIDDAIDAWHRSNEKLTLPNWLGWSPEEYSAWVSDPAKIPCRPLQSR